MSEINQNDEPNVDLGKMPKQLRDFILEQQKTNKDLTPQQILAQVQKQAQQQRVLTSQQFLELKKSKTLPLDEENGLLIVPDKSLVIKSKLSDQEKIFINVLTHPAIESPEEKQIIQNGDSLPAI